MGNETNRPGVLGRVAATALLVVAAGVVGTTHAQQLTWTQIAGGTWTGDGGAAKSANLVGVGDVAIDKAGNMYVSQSSANRIRKITPQGVISTLVGGSSGFGGDGGPVSKAFINKPAGLKFDAAGNLYFVDSGNRRVRRIAVDGTITTVAGNGIAAHAGDGGQATSASFMSPYDVAIDKNGNLFVSDTDAQRVRKITPQGVISTYAGSGVRGTNAGEGGPATAAQFWGPYGIDVDATGVLYITDAGNRAIRKVTTDGIISTFMPGVTTYEIHVDAAGSVYFNYDCALIKQSGSTQVVYGGVDDNCRTRSAEGANGIGTARFGYIEGITTDSAGNVYFGDWTFARVVKIAAADGKAYTHAGAVQIAGQGATALGANLADIEHLSVGDDGSIAFHERAPTYRIRRIAGGKISAVAGSGLEPWDGCDDFYYDCSSAFAWDMIPYATAAASGGLVYVSNVLASGVQRAALDGKITQFAGGLGGSPMVENGLANNTSLSVRGMALDSVGNMYLAAASTGVDKVYRVDTAGKITTYAGNGTRAQTGDGGLAKNAALFSPRLVATDGADNVYVYELPSTIRRISRGGVITKIGGVANADTNAPTFYSGEGGPALSAKLGNVTSLAAHALGVYFTSEGKVRRIRPDGKIETLTSLPYYAKGVAIKTSVLYVATSNGRIYRAKLPRVVPTDFNGDHRSDLFWRGNTGVNRIWLSAESTTVMAAATIATENKLVAQGDFDGDGKADLVWRNTINGNNIVWRAGNANTIMVLATQADQNWTIVGAGDFNGDGKSDLLWRNKLTGANEIWLTGNSATKKAASSITDLKWVLAGIGDFDGDGKSDVLWRHTQTGGNLMWSAASSGASTYLPSLSKLTWKVAAVGDFNGDSVSDIVWRDTATGANQIWKSANAYTQMYLTTVPNPSSFIAAAGDYDNDGIDDLVWRNSATGANTLWKNAVASNQRAMAVWGLSWKIQPVEAQP